MSQNDRGERGLSTGIKIMKIGRFQQFYSRFGIKDGQFKFNQFSFGSALSTFSVVPSCRGRQEDAKAGLGFTFRSCVQVIECCLREVNIVLLEFRSDMSSLEVLQTTINY